MLKKTRILVVDDSATVRAHHLELLKGLNAEIHSANDGQQALSMAMQTPYSLVITDVDMPEMNGIELCQALQANSRTRDIPIVIVSTFDSDVDVESGFEAGASAYLSKRDARSLLLSTVTEILWKYIHVRKRRILVIEDSRTIARSLEMGLLKHSFIVMLAENGLKAKEIVVEVAPDLILCDLKMPQMDGFAFCKWLKSVPGLFHTPVIAMSAAEDTATVQRVIQYGAAAFISKPFSMSQLVPLIDRILSDHFKIILTERERLDAERRALVNSITSLVAALEARDAYTRGHSESVSWLATHMLQCFGADSADIDLLAIGGRLHDIGKIGIRDSVLLKPDLLEEAEFEHIKQHPVIGRRILESIPSLNRILAIPYSHHERWDGKGYPEGLSGKSIPFWARLTSVADTFDALTSDRPYRKGMSIEKALQVIKQVRGTQLCPDCVDLFLLVAESAGFEDHFRAKQHEEKGRRETGAPASIAPHLNDNSRTS